MKRPEGHTWSGRRLTTAEARLDVSQHPGEGTLAHSLGKIEGCSRRQSIVPLLAPPRIALQFRAVRNSWPQERRDCGCSPPSASGRMLGRVEAANVPDKNVSQFCFVPASHAQERGRRLGTELLEQAATGAMRNCSHPPVTRPPFGRQGPKPLLVQLGAHPGLPGYAHTWQHAQEERPRVPVVRKGLAVGLQRTVRGAQRLPANPATHHRFGSSHAETFERDRNQVVDSHRMEPRMRFTRSALWLVAKWL